MIGTPSPEQKIASGHQILVAEQRPEVAPRARERSNAYATELENVTRVDVNAMPSHTGSHRHSSHRHNRHIQARPMLKRQRKWDAPQPCGSDVRKERARRHPLRIGICSVEERTHRPDRDSNPPKRSFKVGTPQSARADSEGESTVDRERTDPELGRKHHASTHRRRMPPRGHRWATLHRRPPASTGLKLLRAGNRVLTTTMNDRLPDLIGG
jgi:hypothetical protein